MSASPARTYGGRSADERREARRRRLLDAGLDLIGTDGWSATTVRAVCARAGLSARFFYESFADLDALAVAVFDEVLGRALIAAHTAMEAAAAGEARLRAGVDALLADMTDDPRRARLAFVEALGSGPLMEARMRGMRTLAALLAHEMRGVADVPADDDFAELVAIGLSGALTELMIVWLGGELAQSRDELVDDVVALVVLNAEGAAAVARKRRQRRARPSR